MPVLPVAAGCADGARCRLRGLALAAAGLYLVWNVRWLVRGQVPPSMALGIFGVPAPTTGGMRSWRCLRRGDLPGALFWNAFLVPLLALLLGSVGVLGHALCKGRELVLPVPMGKSWEVVLALAWSTKLLQGKSSW